MNEGKQHAHVPPDYGPDDTDFKRKKNSNSWDKVEDSENDRSPADNNSTSGIGE